MLGQGTPLDGLPPPTCALQALEYETERICNSASVASALERFVEFDPVLGYNTPIHRSRPTLTLKLADMADSAVIDRRFPIALKALSTLLAHSFRLNKFPKVKARLWGAVLGSMIWSAFIPSEDLDIGEDYWMIEYESFPEVTIAMDRKGRMMEEHMDAIYEFFTTPPEHGMNESDLAECAQFVSDKVAIRLSFNACKLTPECLRLIESMLDRVFASPTRQYAVASLDFSNILMKVAHLKVVVDIVKKCHAVYHIEQVKVFNATKGNTKVEARELQRIVAAASNVSLSHVTSLSTHGAQPLASSLRRLGVGFNKLDREHVAAICSSLRYGCQLESLSLNNTLVSVNDADRMQCWRWIAFAIFHPRSKKLAAENKFRSVDLSANPFRLEDAVAFINTLSDPAGELVYQGRRARTQKRHELLLCTVQRGAKFYQTAQVGGMVIHELVYDRELEALCQESEWTCVVLPGIGFGWVANDQISSSERETIDESDREAIDVECTWTGMRRSCAAFLLLLERVGCHLSYLDLSCLKLSINDQPIAVLPAVLQHCVKLKHLRLIYCDLNDDTVSMLIEQLNGEFGDRLLSLDLSHNFYICSSSIEALACSLSNRDRIPALQELRICVPYISSEAVASLRQALHVNKKLRFLELLGPERKDDEDGSGFVDEDEAVAHAQLGLEQDLLVEAADGELLPPFLPLILKLGFLSVIQHKSMTRSALNKLDSFVVSSIFKFASEEVRRHILLEEPMPNQQY